MKNTPTALRLRLRKSQRRTVFENVARELVRRFSMTYQNFVYASLHPNSELAKDLAKQWREK